MKLYLLCCNYKNECEYKGWNYKAISFEQIRDSMLKKDNSSKVNKEIRKGLLFLKAIGLIDFIEGKSINRKGMEVPCFKIEEVRYYINYKITDFKKGDVMDDKLYNEIYNRISK